MEEKWATIEEYPNYQVSNLGHVERIGKTKRTPIKVAHAGNYFFCSLTYAPYKSKQVDVRKLMDKYFDEHCLQDKSALDIEGEIWRDVVGWEDCYEVSNLGRIRSKEFYKNGKNGSTYLMKSKIKQAYLDDDGYQRVSLYKGYESKLAGVHRVVAEAFVPNPDNLPQVNHKNGIKDDNRAANLEWVTNTDNIRHSIRQGLRDPHKFASKVICKETGHVYESVSELSRQISDSYFSYNRILYLLNQSSTDYVNIKGFNYKYI